MCLCAACVSWRVLRHPRVLPNGACNRLVTVPPGSATLLHISRSSVAKRDPFGHICHGTEPTHRALADGVRVREVHDAPDIRVCEPWCVGIAIDGDHAVAEILRPLDDGSLVATRADDEDGLHRRRCY